MESFKSSGEFTKQAHVKIPKGLYESEHGRKGFFGNVSQLYHENPLTNWETVDGELKPRSISNCYNAELAPNTCNLLLHNNDCQLSVSYQTENFSYFMRNADYDEIYFIHDGEGIFETTYGHVPVKKGDYLILPRGTTYKYYVNKPTKFLLIQSSAEYEQPTRGILGPNALYDQTALFVPEAALGTEVSSNGYVVAIQHAGSITKVRYPFNPLDVKGWKGSVYPWRLSIYDFCPINSHKYHIPPSGHTTFVTKNFVVCSFVARPLEHSSEEVLKVPFYHLNSDYDEVLFYHQGNFFSRDHINPGAITFHPQGIHHGPHPKAFNNTQDKLFTDEFAVMIDTRNPLKRTPFFDQIENTQYINSWK
jgi:homogentisate 1,2-dioxygenase